MTNATNTNRKAVTRVLARNAASIGILAAIIVIGFSIGSYFKARNIEEFEDFYTFVQRLLYGGKLDIVYRDITPFLDGLPNLKSAGNNVPGAQQFDVRLELVRSFDRNKSRFRRLAQGVGRVDFRVAYDQWIPPSENLDLVSCPRPNDLPNTELKSNGTWAHRCKIEPCSAILVTTSLILTARHCLYSSEAERDPSKIRNYEIEAARFWSGYYGDDCRNKSGSASSTASAEAALDTSCDTPLSIRIERKPLFEDRILDVAVLRIWQSDVETNGARLRAAILTPAEPDIGQDLVVLHHPLGGAMFLTRSNCRVISLPSVNGSKDERSSFKHSCGTLPGTSGAPVFSEQRGSVIAMHVRGDRSIEAVAENDGRAVPVSLISKALVMSDVPEVKALGQCIEARRTGQAPFTPCS